MADTAAKFRRRLIRSGLSESAVDAAWPDWWSDAAEASPSAQAELKFSIARKLGLDPRSLLDEGAPRFVWDDSVKYKGFRGDPGKDRPAISAFGTAVARMLLSGCSSGRSIVGLPAAELRKAMLSSGQPFIRLQDLIALLWGIGVPVVHLRVHPLSAKRMCAMSVNVGQRYAILLARDASYPAPTAFHLAHEVGHIALGHVLEGSSVVDMSDASDREDDSDPEEIAADKYALELLTGFAHPDIEVQGKGHSARELAQQVTAVGFSRQIEPGTLALCYGYATGDWDTTFASLPTIYEQAGDVWRFVNKVAVGQLQWDLMTDESASFTRALLGGIA